MAVVAVGGRRRRSLLLSLWWLWLSLLPRVSVAVFQSQLGCFSLSQQPPDAQTLPNFSSVDCINNCYASASPFAFAFVAPISTDNPNTFLCACLNNLPSDAVPSSILCTRHCKFSYTQDDPNCGGSFQGQIAWSQFDTSLDPITNQPRATTTAATTTAPPLTAANSTEATGTATSLANLFTSTAGGGNGGPAPNVPSVAVPAVPPNGDSQPSSNPPLSTASVQLQGGPSLVPSNVGVNQPAGKNLLNGTAPNPSRAVDTTAGQPILHPVPSANLVSESGFSQTAASDNSTTNSSSSVPQSNGSTLAIIAGCVGAMLGLLLGCLSLYQFRKRRGSLDASKIWDNALFRPRTNGIEFGDGELFAKRPSMTSQRGRFQSGSESIDTADAVFVYGGKGQPQQLVQVQRPRLDGSGGTEIVYMLPDSNSVPTLVGGSSPVPAPKLGEMRDDTKVNLRSGGDTITIKTRPSLFSFRKDYSLWNGDAIGAASASVNGTSIFSDDETIARGGPKVEAKSIANSSIFMSHAARNGVLDLESAQKKTKGELVVPATAAAAKVNGIGEREESSA